MFMGVIDGSAVRHGTPDFSKNSEITLLPVMGET
jgi:hypothetical protein